MFFKKKQKLFPQKKDRLHPFWTPKVQSRQQQIGSFAVSSIPASEPASIFKTNPRLCGACFPQTPTSCAFFSQHHPRAPFFLLHKHHLCFFHSTHLYFFHSIVVFFTTSSPGTTAIAPQSRVLPADYFVQKPPTESFLSKTCVAQARICFANRRRLLRGNGRRWIHFVSDAKWGAD